MDNEVDNFLNEVKGKEPEDPFKENESPFLEDEDEKDEVVAEEDKKDEKVPFHKDPKMQKYLEKRERQLREEILGEIKPAPVKEEKVADVNLPESFVRLVGDDTYEKKQVLKDLSDYFGSLKGEARQEFLREMEQREEQSLEEDRRAATELDSGFEAIEDEFGVDADTPEFRSFIRRVSPKDTEGNVTGFPDLVETYRTFTEISKPDNSRAKQLASRGMKRSSDASKLPEPKGSSWEAWDRIKSALK